MAIVMMSVVLAVKFFFTLWSRRQTRLQSKYRNENSTTNYNYDFKQYYQLESILYPSQLKL